MNYCRLGKSELFISRIGFGSLPLFVYRISHINKIYAEETYTLIKDCKKVGEKILRH
jgi:hypothetical protein